MKISLGGGGGGNAELRARLDRCHANVRRLRGILQMLNDKVIAVAPAAIPAEVAKEVHEGLQLHIDVDI